ncbi:MAG: elongation factor G, partial [Alphaproteobacteria bacterium]
LEQLLEDVVPEPKAIYGTYAQSFGQDRVVPVLLGSGEAQNGIVRLWKTLRHDTPGPDVTARRRKIDTKEAPVVEAFKSLHAAHAGKLTLARIWAGGLAEGESLGGFRVGGLAHVVGSKQEKTDKAGPGEVIALGRLDEVQTGETLMKSKHEKMAADWPVLDPVYALALITEKREDEVRLTEALHKLIEEDASYQVEQNAETHELVLWGQGEMHLRVAIERLQNRYNISVKTKPPRVAYRETIRKPVKQHGRHKKQSGGHGQFGDVHLEIVPKPRGSGFEFVDKVVGGAVPRQFIGSVEAGVREYLQKGPLGFPVVDLSVCLFDGQHHAVDSSDQAFRAAAQLAMREGMPQGNPILLEPIYKVVIHVPAEYTSKATKLVTGRRGQILGFEANETRKGWDDLQAYLPQAEMHDLIIDLRSLSQGVGNYSFVFDHLAELTGKEAGRVIGQHAASDAG